MMKLQANWIHKANIYTYYQMASSLYEHGRKMTHFSLLFICPSCPNPCIFVNLSPSFYLSTTYFSRNSKLKSFHWKLMVQVCRTFDIIPHPSDEYSGCFFAPLQNQYIYTHLWYSVDINALTLFSVNLILFVSFLSFCFRFCFVFVFCSMRRKSHPKRKSDTLIERREKESQGIFTYHNSEFKPWKAHETAIEKLNWQTVFSVEMQHEISIKSFSKWILNECNDGKKQSNRFIFYVWVSVFYCWKVSRRVCVCVGGV